MAASLIPSEGGSPIALDKPITLIGRSQACDISLQTSPKVSRRHCCIVQCGDRYLLRDLGSMNGVRVNTHRIAEVALQPGDEVAVADVNFNFRLDEYLTNPPVELPMMKGQPGGTAAPSRREKKRPAAKADDAEKPAPAYSDKPIADDELGVEDDSHTGAAFVEV